MGLFKDCGCGCDGRKQQEKFVTSLISGLTFFVIANPETFRVMRRILGPRVATPTGCPSTLGLLIHSVVFILIVWGMMNVKQELPELNKHIKEDKEEDKSDMISPPKRMIDIVPHMGMKDPDFVDTGLQLEAHNINNEGAIY